MGYSVFPAAAGSKTPTRVTLTSGTSYTVPAGVTSIIATLHGGGGAGGASDSTGVSPSTNGLPGAVVISTISTTPGDSIAYAIGAGGTGVAFSTNNGVGGAGGTTTFTGATSAVGGNPGIPAGISNTNGVAGVQLATQNNGGSGSWGATRTGGSGGAGAIYLEYWT